MGQIVNGQGGLGNLTKARVTGPPTNCCDGGRKRTGTFPFSGAFAKGLLSAGLIVEKQTLSILLSALSIPSGYVLHFERLMPFLSSTSRMLYPAAVACAERV
jgi:hypothetical protein